MKLLKAHTILYFIQKHAAIFILGISFLILLVYTFTSNAILDEGDGISHYQMAKFSWEHPSLLLNHWGKPLYTLFASPFCQFGFKGLQIFNILLACSSAYVAYLISKKLELNAPHFSILFCLFAPVYFHVTLSGLTEILFSFLLIATIYLLFLQKWALAAIISSFLFFSRPEATFIVPILIFYFLIHKKHAYIPLFAFGFVLFSCIGGFVFKDVLWVFHKYPYVGGKDMYGNGDFFKFFKDYRGIWGNPLTLLIIIGLIYKCFTFSKNNRYVKEEFILIIGSALACLFVHSFLWWKGLQGSLGLTRVMACVIPCFAIIANYSLQVFYSFFKKNWLVYFHLFIALVVLYIPFKYYPLPLQKNKSQQLIDQVVDYCFKNKLLDKKVVYMYPYFGYKANLDPFDEHKTTIMWGLDQTQMDYHLAIGTIVVWDNIMSPNEGFLPFTSLSENKNFELLKKFETVKENEQKMEVYIFKKIN